MLKPLRKSKYPRFEVGQQHKTKSYGMCEVIYVEGTGSSRSLITIKFLDTGNTTVVRGDDVRKGSVRDRMSPTVYGVGYLGYGKYKASSDAYNLWYAILQRCYNPSYYSNHTKKSYSHVEVCKEWHDFQAFAEFYEQHYIPDYQLDKDILVPNSTVYSPETCMFVPRTVNNAEAILRCLVKEDPSYTSLLESFYEISKENFMHT